MAAPKFIGNDCLETLLKLLGLSDDLNGMSDVVFVAIDFENAQSIWENTSSKMGCQVGIAILDTRKIERRRLAATSLYLDNELDESPSKGAEELITTYNFAGGPVEYCQRAKVKSSFLFGKTIFIDQSDMRQKIESCLPQERDIILVGHDLYHDLKALETLGLNFKVYSPWNAIDTLTIARKLFPPKSKSSLRGILRKLKCPYNGLHCAGNDANFTLRAMLLLAARACQQTHPETSRILAMIATTSVYYFGQPDHPVIKQRELKKKEKGELREMREYLQNVKKIVRAQRAVTAEMKDEGELLEEGDLFRLEASCYNQERAAAELRNKDDILEGEDLRWVEVSRYGLDTDCVARPWGLQWVMLHDQA